MTAVVAAAHRRGEETMILHQTVEQRAPSHRAGEAAGPRTAAEEPTTTAAVVAEVEPMTKEEEAPTMAVAGVHAI